MKRIAPLHQTDPEYEELTNEEHQAIFWKNWLALGEPIPGWATPEERAIAENVQKGLVETKRFNPNQPRDPGGEGGGQWVKAGGSGVAGGAKKADVPRLPNGVGPVDELVEKSEQQWLAGESAVPYLAEKHGMTVEQYLQAVEDKAEEQLFDAEVTIRTPATLVDEIVNDGRFKSQFETGTSEATLSPSLRSGAESKMFSYPPDLPGHERPIYGYMRKPNIADQGARTYGAIRWELKRDVRDRATFTGADSLALDFAPAPVEEPSFHALATPPPDPLTDERGIFAQTPYVEAQIHGGVTLDDVAAVVIPKHFQDAAEHGSSLPDINPQYKIENELRDAVAKLKARGITVEYE